MERVIDFAVIAVAVIFGLAGFTIARDRLF